MVEDVIQSAPPASHDEENFVAWTEAPAAASRAGPRNPWRGEIVAFHGQMAKKLRRDPGQRQRVDLADAWRLASQDAAVKRDRPDLAAEPQRSPPLTLRRLEDDEPPIDDLLAAL